MVPFPLTANSWSELEPARLSTMRPAESKMNENGTGDSAFVTGAAESRPSGVTAKTSTVLLVLVVTMSCDPLGVNPTSAGELRKNGGVELPRPRVRLDRAI